MAISTITIIAGLRSLQTDACSDLGSVSIPPLVHTVQIILEPQRCQPLSFLTIGALTKHQVVVPFLPLGQPRIRVSAPETLDSWKYRQGLFLLVGLS